MSSKELKKSIQEQFSKCEQTLMKAIEHTKNRIGEYIDQFQKEQLNLINKCAFDLLSQLKQTNDSDTQMNHHLMSSVQSLGNNFPEFQKILKAQVRMPVREILKKVQFSMPTVDVLPISYNLQHNKSLSLSTISDNQPINCVTSLPSYRIAIAVLSKIKILDAQNERILASIVAHTDKITSLTSLSACVRISISDSLSTKIKKHASQKSLTSSLKSNRSKTVSQELSMLRERGIENRQHSSSEDTTNICEENKWELARENVLISTSLDKRCQIINLRDFKLLNTLNLRKHGQNAIQLSEREILIQQTDSISIFLDLKKKIGEFNHTAPIIRCGFSKQLQMILIHSKNKIFTLNKPKLRIITQFAAPADSFFLKVIDKYVLIVHANGLQFQNVITGEIDKKRILSMANQICSISDMLDERHIAVITVKNEVFIIDYLSMKIRSNLCIGGKLGNRSITYMHDGKNFAINGIDNKIKLWSFSSD